ncbi:LYR motif-containing protein 4 [Bombyx mandarina]|uniref:Complex 1 LYR protein domain-containing protein n=2 Tax=Bombyx TaxID=7090 RepID=A0A8R2AHF0_BOMMO|nr:LYR motif-containing protein 4 [Bombyx mori]XP_028039836.1 LYR motif-containing protein 4 [Bombyx mandarina]
MSGAIPKIQILSLYKLLLRESQKFPNYNFRAYALRRIRDAFKDNKNVSDVKIVKKEFEFGKENLNVIRRQAAIGNMYKTEKLVIENLR